MKLTIARELRIEAEKIRDGLPCDDATLLDVAATALAMKSAMTPLEFKASRLALGLNQRQMAAALRVASEATVRSWESGRRPVPGPVSVAMELMLAYEKDALASFFNPPAPSR